MIDPVEYAAEFYREVKGFELNGQNLLAISLLSRAQCKRGIVGDLLEIGVFHGRTLIMLGALRQAGERVIGIDAFERIDEIQHEDRQVDLDYYGSGRAIKDSFLGNWRKFIVNGGKGSDAELTLIEKDSRAITVDELRGHTKGVRLFSLDGGHSEASTYHDLELAEAVVNDGGILILDDYFLEDCPAVSVGAMRYFLTRQSKFVPFLIFCGRVFFTTPGNAEFYQEEVLNGDIYRWVRFGEFLSCPVIALVDRERRDKRGFERDVASWREYRRAYVDQQLRRETVWAR